MAAAVTYTNFGGMLVHENRGGVETEYVNDTLGSLVECRDASGTKTYEATYWPYGEIRTSSGTNPSPWAFVGLLGYYRESASRTYVRARYYRQEVARWMTEDPLWPGELAYVYANADPVEQHDRSGTSPGCIDCTLAIGASWTGEHPLHICNNHYSHCMSCCVLASLFGRDCAIIAQQLQCLYKCVTKPFEPPSRNQERMDQCKTGISVAHNIVGAGTDIMAKCHQGCSKMYPLPNINNCRQRRYKLPYCCNHPCAPSSTGSIYDGLPSVGRHEQCLPGFKKQVGTTWVAG